MDWIRLILDIFGIIGSIDLIRLIFIKEDKQQKAAEAKKALAEAKDKELEIVRHANELLSKQLERSHETIQERDKTIAAKDSIIEAKNQDIAKLRATVTSLFDVMCVHKGCRLRKPHQGRGSQWYEQFCEDPALGCDYLSIDTLLKQERKERLEENTAKSNDSEDGKLQ